MTQRFLSTGQPEGITKKSRQTLNGHDSAVLWFTGLSGAGKSTLANAVENELHQRGIRTFLLDGDTLRQGLTSDLGFEPEDRRENVRRVGYVAKILVDAGVVVLAALISPFREERQRARELFEPGEFIEVFVDCPLEVCEQRDVKGLYRKARNGIIPEFTGISSPYEFPENPEIHIDSNGNSVSEDVQQILTYLEQSGLIHHTPPKS